jgi:hypothetical protein
MAASTALITDLTTATNTNPTTATQIKSTAAAGPNQDTQGNISLALGKMKEAKNLLQQVQAGTDSSDPNYTTVGNVLLTLV